MRRKRKSPTIRRPQVFLTYASADKGIADRIVEEFRQRGIRTWLDAYELDPGDSIAKTIKDAISASDYLVVLLSPSSVSSVWVRQELAAALSRELTTRDITLLPVMIAECEIPGALAPYHHFLDLRRDFEQGVTRLIEHIRLASRIDFSELDPRTFESLVVDLLTKAGFATIKREWGIADPREYIRAEFSRLGPFGLEAKETWLIETKFYPESRADLRSIRQGVEYISRLPGRVRGLVVTNGQLTSAARDFLASAEAQSAVEIRIIDGMELRRLLLEHKNLVDKYFVGKMERLGG